MVVERNDRVGHAPRAKTINVRSRELFRRWGIAERLAKASPFGVEYPSNIVFATRMAGHVLARFENAFYCSPVRDDRFAEHAQWIPQYKVEEVLRARALEFNGVQIRMQTELVEFTQTDAGVQALLRCHGSQETEPVQARYLVGADGARSTVREQLGIRMEGISPLAHHYNAVFRAPGLTRSHSLGEAVMYWIVNPESPAVIAPLDRDDVWTFSCVRQGSADVDALPLIHAALGLKHPLPLEIMSEDVWTAHELIAQRYRSGRVFLAGDACHLHPPYGGYGMNMGMGDAMDLGWKLAAVLKGWGTEQLLDSYEIERRQVHRRVVDESVANHASTSLRLAESGMEAEGAEGEALRVRVGARILERKRREFDSLGVVIGSRYASSPVLGTEPEDALQAQDSWDYRPSARPGCRLPHAWLAEGRAYGASLYDHLAKEGLSLLVTRPEALVVAQQIHAAGEAAGLPLQIVQPQSASLSTLCGAGVVLVRPDQHVAWRGDDAADGCAALLRATGRSAQG